MKHQAPSPKRKRRIQAAPLDSEFKRGSRSHVLREFSRLLRPYKGWDSKKEDPWSRWHRLVRFNVHRDLIGYYVDHAEVLESLQIKYKEQVPPQTRKKLLSQRCNVRTLRHTSAFPPDLRELVQHPHDVGWYFAEMDQAPLCSSQLPLALALGCRLLCDYCVGAARHDVAMILKLMREDQVGTWDELGKFEQGIVEVFLRLRRRLTGKEVAAECRDSPTYDNPNFKRALRKLVRLNILVHHGSGRDRRGGYELLNRPRRLPDRYQAMFNETYSTHVLGSAAELLPARGQ